MGIQQRSMGSKLLSTFQMLFVFMLPFLVLAQQQNPNDGLLGDGRSINLTWQRIVAGFILLPIGIILTFRGYRNYRFTMFLAGFVAGCVILYSILANVEPAQGWNRRQIIYVFSCIGGGLLIGAICWVFHRYTVWILGALAGLMVALYVLAWRSEGLIRSKAGRIGLLVGASVLGLLLALVFGRRILIPATSLVGAYLTVIGIDLFARTGFSESINEFFTKNNSVNYQLNTNLYIMLGVVGGLILLGLLFQSLAYRHRMSALAAQGRTSHDYDGDWSILGRRKPVIQPDPTYAHNGTDTYNGGYNTTNGYGHDANGNNTTTAYTTEKPKKSWNPFKKNTAIEQTTTPTPTTTATHSDYPDSRVSYSSNAALNQNAGH